MIARWRTFAAARGGRWIGTALPLLIGGIGALLLAGGALPDWLFIGGFQVTLSALLFGGGAALSALSVVAIWRAERRRRGLDAQIAAVRIEASANAQALERGRQAESRRRFLRRLDHELKNPLTILRVGLGNLHVPPDEIEAVARLEQQTLRLSKLVTDLRRLAELDAVGVERERVDLREVLEEAIELAADPDAPRVIHLSVQQIPWAISPIWGDRDLLAVAFRNLIDNALKYTDADRQIEVRAHDNGTFALIEIADEGRGIADADLPYIREELYRGENARDVTGSGLGLPLVQRIIDLHGGALDVRSRATVGTVFTVRLPLKL